MSFCLPARILTAAPYLIGLILLCLVILMGMYVWRELLSRGDNGGRAELGLLVGLLIMSVIVIVFFVTFVVFSLTGSCTRQVGVMALPARLQPLRLPPPVQRQVAPMQFLRLFNRRVLW